MRLPGNVPVDMTTNAYIPSAENHPLDAMCEVTGGNPSLPLQPRLEIPQNLPNLNIHLFTGYVWNSSFIQAETGTIPRELA